MNKLRIKYIHAAWMLLSLLHASRVANAQYYDLTLGTERHLTRCYGLNTICPTSEQFETAIEKVIGEVELNGKSYAVVVFTGWEGTDEDGNPIRTIADTTLYRMEHSILFENINGVDRAIFDFGFNIGDSLSSILRPYVDVNNLTNYWVDQLSIAPIILGDSLFHFHDGLDRKIIWGSRIIVTPQGDTLPSSSLEFSIEDNLPRPEFQLFDPFLYIEGMGVMLTAPTHRGRIICGYKNATGEHFGCEAPRLAVSIEMIKESLTNSITINGSYPNPFNPSTNISYELHKSGLLNISLYSSGGKLLRFSGPEATHSGLYTLVVDMTSYASGVYFVVFEFDHEIKTHIITFIK